MKKFLIFLPLFIILILSGLPYGIAVRRYKVSSPKINAEIKIALISDLHGEDYKKPASLVKAEKPDIIVLCGDIFDESAPDDNGLSLIRELLPAAPVYYVTGNHEEWRSDTGKLKSKLIGMGVTVIDNFSDRVDIRGQKILLSGIDDPGFYGTGRYMRRLTELQQPTDDFTVLIAHRPDFCAHYDRDLVLCGHTHGGLMRIPFLPGGLVAPGQGLFPRYAGGIYEYKPRKHMVVSRGLAKHTGVCPRMWNSPEICIIDLD